MVIPRNSLAVGVTFQGIEQKSPTSGAIIAGTFRIPSAVTPQPVVENPAVNAQGGSLPVVSTNPVSSSAPESYGSPATGLQEASTIPATGGTFPVPQSGALTTDDLTIFLLVAAGVGIWFWLRSKK
jgi:hypothetical protein